MMAAPIAVVGAGLKPGAPVVLFPTRIVGGGVEARQGQQYDVAPDGRFLINTELPGDVAQTYVRDPAGNLMEIDTPGASRLPEDLRAQMKQLDELYPQDEANRRARLPVRAPAAR